MVSELVKTLRDRSFRFAHDIYFIPTTKDLLSQAADAIEELSVKVARQNMERSSQYYGGGWIPCSERLPDDDVPVLVTFVDKDDKKYTDVAITSYGQEYFGGKPLNSKDWKPPFRYFENNYKIIAWQPLPPAYEPKNREDDETPECFIPEENNPYPLCVGNGSKDCENCCLYVDYPEPPFD